MIRDFAMAGSAGGAGATAAHARLDFSAVPRTANARPPGPIGVRLYCAICWVIFAGSALQWLVAH